jgi:hypothetical protein
MKRILVFDGPTAAERFLKLHNIRDLGIQECIEKRERTVDDVESQADLDEMFRAIGVRYEEAKRLGTADPDIVDAERDIEAQQAREGLPARPFTPRTSTQAHMLFLRPTAAGEPAPRMVLEEGGTYKYLVKMLEKGATRASGSLALTIRDLRQFLDKAPKSDDGTLPEDKPLPTVAVEKVEQPG